MSSEKKTVIVKYVKGSERFELIVYADAALDYRQNKVSELDKVVAVDEVFTDSSKGLRAPRDKLKKAFGTDNVKEIEKEIVLKGDLPLTTEQRRRLIEEKKKQIISFISKNYVDPKTNMPHPPLRIEQAMGMISVQIDPFKPAEEQARAIVDKLRPYLALKTGNVTLYFKIPSKYVYQTIKVIKEFGEVKEESWGSDGSYSGKINIPVASQSAFFDRVYSATHGEALVKLVE